MTYTLFAATEEAASGGLPLDINLQSFVFQLVSFLIVFYLIKRFAVTPVMNLLEKRRQTIDEGVKMGITFEEKRALLEKDVKQIMRDARKEADNIIGNGHKEAREILRDAETKAKRKSDAMFKDAEARINEEAKQSRKKLEQEIVELVAEATEAVVGEKVDAKKDAHIIKKVINKRTKSSN